jgi:hypothetical protein
MFPDVCLINAISGVGCPYKLDCAEYIASLLHVVLTKLGNDVCAFAPNITFFGQIRCSNLSKSRVQYAFSQD